MDDISMKAFIINLITSCKFYFLYLYLLKDPERSVSFKKMEKLKREIDY